MSDAHDLLQAIYRLSMASGFPWVDNRCSMCGADDDNARDHTPDCLWLRLSDFVLGV